MLGVLEHGPDFATRPKGGIQTRNRAFNALIIGLILLTAALVGLETSDAALERFGLLVARGADRAVEQPLGGAGVARRQSLGDGVPKLALPPGTRNQRDWTVRSENLLKIQRLPPYSLLVEPFAFSA